MIKITTTTTTTMMMMMMMTTTMIIIMEYVNVPSNMHVCVFIIGEFCLGDGTYWAYLDQFQHYIQQCRK